MSRPPLPPTLLPPVDDDERPRSSSFPRWLIFPIIAVIAAFALGMGVERKEPRIERVALAAKEGGRADAGAENEPNGIAGANNDDSPPFLKLIPDQKAYVGTPDTVIDLSTVFAETDVMQDGVNVTFKVVHNTDDELKSVEAVIEGDRLILKWKKPGKAEIRLRATNETGATVDVKFLTEVWLADYLQLVFTVIGGLGIFLLGMKFMSEGLQTVAGNGLRRMIAMVTDNRFLAIGAGTLATTIVQSSSITTVMVVGFVNSGFMMLHQAIGVIMGANIGTTITGWILVLKVGKYGLPLIGVCVFGYLFFRNERWRFLSMFGMGLGMVFFGLELMKDGFSIIKDLPAFEAWFHQFSADDYFGVLKCAAVGCLLTFLVQSSSATLGITIGLATIGVIPFQTAAALVLGENIGTTITALFACIGTTRNAIRAAVFHMLFNLIGVAWITYVFDWYIPWVETVVRYFDENGALDTTAAIAATHTGFNVLNTLVFVPFMGLFARLLNRVIPQTAVKETPHLTSLDIRLVETPVIAIEQSRYEVSRMADGCQKMMDWLKECLTSDPPKDALVKKLFHREEVLDRIQDEVTAFMTHLLAANVPLSTIEEGRRQIRMADEYESVSDYIRSILKFQMKLRNQGHRFDEDDRKGILKLHELVDSYLKLVNQAYQERRPEVITKAVSIGDEIKHQVKLLREQHLDMLTSKRVEPFVNLAYNSTLNSYRRVRDHTLNVAELIAGEK